MVRAPRISGWEGIQAHLRSPSRVKVTLNQESLSVPQFYLISDPLMQAEQETKHHNTYKDNFLWDFWCLRLRMKKTHAHHVCKIFASLRMNHLAKQLWPNELRCAHSHCICLCSLCIYFHHKKISLGKDICYFGSELGVYVWNAKGKSRTLIEQEAVLILSEERI